MYHCNFSLYRNIWSSVFFRPKLKGKKKNYGKFERMGKMSNSRENAFTVYNFKVQVCTWYVPNVPGNIDKRTYLGADGVLVVFEHPTVPTCFRHVLVECARHTHRPLTTVVAAGPGYDGVPLTFLRSSRVFPEGRREPQPIRLVHPCRRLQCIAFRYLAPAVTNGKTG